MILSTCKFITSAFNTAISLTFALKNNIILIVKGCFYYVTKT